MSSRRPGFLAALAVAFSLIAAPSALAAAADLSITENGRPDPVSAGQYVTYEVVVTNNGPDAATGVSVTNALPPQTQFVSATFGCTYDDGPRKVTCPIGTMDNGAVVGLEIVLRLTNFSFGGLLANTVKVTSDSDPVAGNDAATFKSNVYNNDHDHQLTPGKAEQFVDFNPGQTKSVTVSCPTLGGNATDGSLRVDNVDQGTGTLQSVKLLESYALAGGGWTFTARNTASGRAQGHVFITCLPAQTEAAGPDDHTHSIDVYAPLESAPLAVTAGQYYDIYRACNANKVVAAAPGFKLAGGAEGELARSEGYHDGTTAGWRFGFRATKSGTIAVSVRCLDRFLGVASGGTHELWLSRPDKMVTVDPDPAARTLDIDCSDEAKGIVTGYSLPDGVSMIGNDPQIKRRSFKLLNTTGGPLDAHLELLCIGDRTGSDPPVATPPAAIASSATVSASGATVPVAITCPSGGCGGVVELVASAAGSRAVAAGAKVIGRTTFKSSQQGKVVARVMIYKRYRSAVRNGDISSATAVVRRNGGKVTKRRKLRLN